MDSLTPEQQALFASIMGNSSQAKALTPTIPAATPPASAAPATPSATAPVTSVNAAPAVDSNRILSQAEIDALIASMG